ncbi:MAG: molybdate ABC transporter substrate-binding protein [Merismopedia sp. SIO2A8]|nr:molybdate ABC transporter substrate-binding protein [Merismopedia sp. SIO2A8]
MVVQRRWFLGTVGAAAITVAGSAILKQANQSTANGSVRLIVSAAASVQDALNEAVQAYKALVPDVAIDLNFASSGALQQQIEQGAPVDVFLSAAPKQMNALADKGLLVPGTRRELLGNQMVLVTETHSTTSQHSASIPLQSREEAIAQFSTLTADTVERIVIGDPESVPAGAYAKEVLSSLQLYDALNSKFVFAKDVRQALTYVESGNVAAGLVYATDAALSSRVQTVAIAPADSHQPIVYPVAVIKTSQQVDAARAFTDFLSSDRSRSAFEHYGFVMLP